MKIAGCEPLELSFLIFTFLKKACSENKVQVKVNGSRRLENGLVVPGSFLMTNRAIATKFEEETIRLKNVNKTMGMDHCFCNVVLAFVCELFKMNLG